MTERLKRTCELAGGTQVSINSCQIPAGVIVLGTVTVGWNRKGTDVRECVAACSLSTHSTAVATKTSRSVFVCAYFSSAS